MFAGRMANAGPLMRMALGAKEVLFVVMAMLHDNAHNVHTSAGWRGQVTQTPDYNPPPSLNRGYIRAFRDRNVEALKRGGGLSIRGRQ